MHEQFCNCEEESQICFKFGRTNIFVDDSLHGGMNDGYIVLLKRRN